MSDNLDYSELTACGEYCVGCYKKKEGICQGCIEADGYVTEWAQSGRCKVHACTREHNVTFCGLCAEFPCKGIKDMIHWKPNVIEQMRELAEGYRQDYK